MSPKRKRTPHSVWQVLVTNYSDDYKPRGDDWSSSESYLCETEVLAMLLCCELMTEEIMKVDDHDHTVIKEKWPKLKAPSDSKEEESHEYTEQALEAMTFKDIREIYDFVVEEDAEYVRVTQSIDVEEKEVLQEEDNND